LAAAIYSHFLAERPIDQSFPPKEIARIAKHVAIALAVAFFIAAGAAGCSSDEDDYCSEGWQPPTPQRSTTNFLRISIVMLGGMTLAFREHGAAHNAA
jgi:hypothetical protein